MLRLRQKPELLIPAGNLEKLQTAIRFGADAVYVGAGEFSLRATQTSFSLGDLKKGVDFAHKSGVKVYLAMNIFSYDSDLPKMLNYLKRAIEIGIDAVIVSDPGLIHLINRHKLNIKIHLSTQTSTLNSEAVKFWQKIGVKRIVLGRELELSQIKKIKNQNPSMEIEVFVHGAMCMAISGRCLLSSYLYGKSANCGNCAQPCRKEWILSDSEGNKISTEGKYFMSAKDLRMIEYIPELIKAGIDSFKIEGRRRDSRYIETTARCYREAIDSYFAKTYTKEKIIEWKKDLDGVYNRGYSTGFYFSVPGKEGIGYEKADNSSKIKNIRRPLSWRRCRRCIQFLVVNS